MKRVKPIYRDHRRWECYKNGMYKTTVDDFDGKLALSVRLLSNTTALTCAMIRVISEYRFSSESHLTCPHLNKRSWLGWAACNIEFGATESVVRVAWNKLNGSLQEQANQCADYVIRHYFETIDNNAQELLF